MTATLKHFIEKDHQVTGQLQYNGIGLRLQRRCSKNWAGAKKGSFWGEEVVHELSHEKLMGVIYKKRVVWMVVCLVEGGTPTKIKVKRK